MPRNTERYRMMFANCPAGIIVWNREGCIEDWNPAATRIFGWTEEEAKAQTSWRFMVPQSLWKQIETIFVQLLRLELPIESVNDNVTKEGNVITCEWRNIPSFDESGQPGGFVSIVLDITERRRTEAALTESEERFRTVFTHASLGMAIMDPACRFLMVNQAYCALTGYTEPELLARDMFSITHPDDLVSNRQHIEKVLCGEIAQYVVEKRYLCKTGEEVWVQKSVSLVRDAQGKPLSITALARDITQHKLDVFAIQAAQYELERANREVKQTNLQLEQAIQHANEIAVLAERDNHAKNILLSALPSIFIGVDEQGRISQWNKAAEMTFGLSAKEMIGQVFLDSGILWEVPLIAGAMDRCWNEQQLVRLDDLRFRYSSGGEGFLGLTLTPIREGFSEVVSVLVLGTDITERKFLETQLGHAQKMESIGQLAAGIAHEINTPTQYIGDNTRFLQEAVGDLFGLLARCKQIVVESSGMIGPAEMAAQFTQAAEEADMDYLLEEIPKAVQQSLDGIAHVAKIVQAMKEFSHPGTEDKVRVDINRAVESTLTVARNEWKYVAEIELDFDLSLPLVPCLPGDFNQVILNIVVNAAHAIADVVGDSGERKGKIVVSTQRTGDWVDIRITDTGGGIPEAVRSRIFDPFFTTKGVGKGTGQGLAIAHSIVVDKHQGRLWFETEAGQGTTFIIRLPLDIEHSGVSKAA